MPIGLDGNPGSPSGFLFSAVFAKSDFRVNGNPAYNFNNAELITGTGGSDENMSITVPKGCYLIRFSCTFETRLAFIPSLAYFCIYLDNDLVGPTIVNSSKRQYRTQNYTVSDFEVIKITTIKLDIPYTQTKIEARVIMDSDRKTWYVLHRCMEVFRIGTSCPIP